MLPALRRAFALALLLALAATVRSQEPPPAPGGAADAPPQAALEPLPPLPLAPADLPVEARTIQWRRDWEKARAEARERNVPILIEVHRDGDPICEATRQSLWPNPEYAALVDAECVPVAVVLAPAGDGAPHAELPADEETAARCPVLGIRCAEHAALALAFPAPWRLAPGALPERRFVDAELRELALPAALPPGMGPEHFRTAIAAAREALGERRATRVQYRFGLVRIERITRAVVERDYKLATLDLKALERDEGALPPSITRRAAEARTSLRAEARRLLERADQAAETNPASAKKLYQRIRDEFPGFPEGEEADRKMRGE